MPSKQWDVVPWSQWSQTYNELRDGKLSLVSLASLATIGAIGASIDRVAVSPSARVIEDLLGFLVAFDERTPHQGERDAARSLPADRGCTARAGGSLGASADGAAIGPVSGHPRAARR